MSEIIRAHVIGFQNTLAGWTATNPVIAQGELVIEQETVGVAYRFKIGDGTTPYLSLQYQGGGGSGDYLGLATTSTVPPTLTTNAFYLTTQHGTFTSIGGLVVPSTALFTVLSYNFGSTTWTFSEILDSATLSTPTIDQVLNVGNTSITKIQKFNNGGGSTVISIDGTGSGLITIDNTNFKQFLDGNNLSCYNDTGTVSLQYFLGFNGSIPILQLKDVASAFQTLFQSGSLSSNIIVSGPPTASQLVGDSCVQLLTNKRAKARRDALATNSATPTFNTDNFDFIDITGQSANITSMTSGLTGTPLIDDLLHIAITSTGTITINWGVSWQSSSISLPTGITGAGRVDLLFCWTSTGIWRLLGIA